MSVKIEIEDASKRAPTVPTLKVFDEIREEPAKVKFNIVDGREGKKAFREVRQFTFGLYRNGKRVLGIVRLIELEYDTKKEKLEAADVLPDLMSLKAALQASYVKDAKTSQSLDAFRAS